MGIRYIIFFQDTNGLSLHGFCPLLGVAEKNQFDYGEMASKYVIKLIPFGNRIIMPHVSELWETKLQICNHGDAIKDAKDLEMVKDVVTEQIFLKTRYLFYNGKGTVSPIVPDNLRDLRLLLGMLLQMQDFPAELRRRLLMVPIEVEFSNSSEKQLLGSRLLEPLSPSVRTSE